MAPNIIKKISCRNFRSYRTFSLNISSQLVVFCGENGAGKTNILEAISLFSSNRGLRKATIADLNAAGSQAASWNVEVTIEKNQYKTLLSTSVQNGRRIAKIDHTVVPTLSKFDEILWLLWIVPSMNNIFINSTSERRNFFDHLVGGHDKHHKNNLHRLSELQRERLHIIFHRRDESWLKILEEKIAIKNIEIAKSRLEFIQLMHEIFYKYQSDFLRPKIEISGQIEHIYLTHSEEEAALEIAERLKRYRYSDSDAQTTTISAQKSSWLATNCKTMQEAENCSTGEQKAFLISLILAALRVYQTHRKGIPVLLLDDLMVYLDKKLRSRLAQELISLKVQTFFTGTDIDFFKDIKDIAQIYKVENSICSPH